MEQVTVIGLAVVAAAVALLTALVAWSLGRVNRIAAGGFRSAREILKDEHE